MDEVFEYFKLMKAYTSKIKVDFNSIEFIFTVDITFNVGISIGVIEQNSGNKLELKEPIETVDKKLYEAKKRGKN